MPVRRRPSEDFQMGGCTFRLCRCRDMAHGRRVRVFRRIMFGIRLTTGFGYTNFTFLSFFEMESRTRKGKQSMKVVTRRLLGLDCLEFRVVSPVEQR